MKKVLIGVGVGFVVFVIFLLSCVTKIQPGYIGLVYSANGLKPNTLQQGWHIVAPWEKVTDYNISLEQAYLSADHREGSPDNDSFNIPSKEGKDINVDLEFSYRFDESKAPIIYATFRGKTVEAIRSSWMRGKIKAWSSEISSNYTVIDIYSDKRMDLNRNIFKHLKEMFAPYGIVIESANLSRIAVDSQTEKAIQENINAKQMLIKTQLEVQKQEIETSIAKKRAERQKVEIDLRNYELISKAKAEAQANELRNKTITPQMIELEKIRKWNGVLPTVSGGATPLINLGGK